MFSQLLSNYLVKLYVYIEKKVATKKWELETAG